MASTPRSDSERHSPRVGRYPSSSLALASGLSPCDRLSDGSRLCNSRLAVGLAVNPQYYFPSNAPGDCGHGRSVMDRTSRVSPGTLNPDNLLLTSGSENKPRIGGDMR